jgi:phosphoadenosine phosphosulfate reductase
MSAEAIALYAHRSDGYEARVDHARGLLAKAAADHPGGIVQATSLAAEDMVITDMIGRGWLPIAVATLDTGLLHAETVALLPRIETRYGLVVERFEPARAAVRRFVAMHGERAMHDSIEQRKACCALRKLEPLARLLQNRSAWVTGMRRQQSANRGDLAFEERDAQGRAKINALADWTWADVWHYIASNEVPYNPLHDRFHPSIGCAPCTRAIAVGEDFRSGRWWWEGGSARECGLHVRDERIFTPGADA